ncbi:MAG: methyltransferase domain-containing protein [Coleofasciculaceae cyanobacterium]
MQKWYKEDLAYIHDVGFRDYALRSAPGILEILEHYQIQESLIVDLGCGSGLLAREFRKANYHVFGVDVSESLIDIARQRVPDAEFQVASLFKVEIPSCHAVVSVGECFNYLFDEDNNRQILVEVFRRVYKALAPGGIFVFDIAEPGQVTPGSTYEGFTEGEDWLVLVKKEENQGQNILTRRIITFRQVGEYYRRDDEVHHLQLYKGTDLAEELYRVGFQVQIRRSYGQYHLPKAHAALVARKLA